MAPRARPIEERLEDMIHRDPNSGCWLTAAGPIAGGYPLILYRGRRVPAHRAAFECWVGEIPPGLYIDHKCRTRECLNPAHLRAVTPRVNVTENSSGWAARNLAKTHCPSGHPYDDANTYRGAGNPQASVRACRTCKRNRERSRRAKRRGHS